MIKNNLIFKIFLIIMGIGVLSLIFVYNASFFCFDNYICVRNIKDGIVIPILYLSSCILIILLVLFFVSNRLKLIGLITIVIIPIPILFLIFNSPISCGGFMCDRLSSIIFLIPLYPLVTFLVLIISFIYFKIKK